MTSSKGEALYLPTILFSAAEIEEASLKFSVKMAGKAGIFYITEGSAESRLKFDVICKLLIYD